MNDQGASTSARLTQTHRVIRLLTDLASLVGVSLPDDSVGSLTSFVGAVADQAEIAVLNDEHTLADAIVRIDERFKDAGLDPADADGVIDHVRAELIEISQAFADLGCSDDDVTREHALTEIGDAKLLLSRLAMRLGARPLEPLTLAVRKTSARLRVFEDMGGGEHDDPRGLWSIAKRIVMARKS